MFADDDALAEHIGPVSRWCGGLSDMVYHLLRNDRDVTLRDATGEYGVYDPLAGYLESFTPSYVHQHYKNEIYHWSEDEFDEELDAVLREEGLSESERWDVQENLPLCYDLECFQAWEPTPATVGTDIS